MILFRMQNCHHFIIFGPIWLKFEGHVNLTTRWSNNKNLQIHFHSSRVELQIASWCLKSLAIQPRDIWLTISTGRELRAGVKCIVVTIVTGSLWLVRRYRWGQVNLKTISTIPSHQSQRYISRRNTFRREMYRCDYCDGIVEAKCISIQFQRYCRTNHSEPVTIVKTIHFTPERSSLPVTSCNHIVFLLSAQWGVSEGLKAWAFIEYPKDPHVMFLWSVPWINGWVNNRDDLRRHRAHYDVTVMFFSTLRVLISLWHDFRNLIINSIIQVKS